MEEKSQIMYIIGPACVCPYVRCLVVENAPCTVQPCTVHRAAVRTGAMLARLWSDMSPHTLAP